MPKKFISNKGLPIAREKVKLVIPMITCAFVLIGAGRVFTESELVALAAQPPIVVTINSGNQNDGKAYSDNWRLNANNDWEYYENGKKVVNSWVHDHGHWYLLGEDGIMRVGLFESYGKYYLLDDVRGTGTYGKLLKNGGTYKGVHIVADTSSDYEGALDSSTLDSLSGVGIDKSKAIGVTGTQHSGDVNKPKDNDPFNISNYTGSPISTEEALARGEMTPIPLKKTDNRSGGTMITGIYENGKQYAVGTDGKKYQADRYSSYGKRRYFYSADEFMASDWAKYLDSGKQAPDGRIYETLRDSDGEVVGVNSVSITIKNGTYKPLGSAIDFTQTDNYGALYFERVPYFSNIRQ